MLTKTFRLFWISLGRWNRKSGWFFVSTRIYFRGYIWTPFAKLTKRYQGWFGYWN